MSFCARFKLHETKSGLRERVNIELKKGFITCVVDWYKRAKPSEFADLYQAQPSTKPKQPRPYRHAKMSRSREPVAKIHAKQSAALVRQRTASFVYKEVCALVLGMLHKMEHLEGQSDDMVQLIVELTRKSPDVLAPFAAANLCRIRRAGAPSLPRSSAHAQLAEACTHGPRYVMYYLRSLSSWVHVAPSQAPVDVQKFPGTTNIGVGVFVNPGVVMEAGENFYEICHASPGGNVQMCEKRQDVPDKYRDWHALQGPDFFLYPTVGYPGPPLWLKMNHHDEPGHSVDIKVLPNEAELEEEKQYVIQYTLRKRVCGPEELFFCYDFGRPSAVVDWRPQLGCLVEVRWTDGNKYRGIVSELQPRSIDIQFDPKKFTEHLWTCRKKDFLERVEVLKPDWRPQLGCLVEVLWTDGNKYRGMVSELKARSIDIQFDPQKFKKHLWTCRKKDFLKRVEVVKPDCDSGSSTEPDEERSPKARMCTVVGCRTIVGRQGDVLCRRHQRTRTGENDRSCTRHARTPVMQVIHSWMTCMDDLHG